ncbi:MAG: hypothetical protein BWY82_02184 [Verrucomicrobia bacterium ADurb.Bin474]|nr:MAG: hypothetical protein BWY82_02184 [Verrucomicrobia bacterium ADurb.Bin474]
MRPHIPDRTRGFLCKTQDLGRTVPFEIRLPDHHLKDPVLFPAHCKRCRERNVLEFKWKCSELILRNPQPLCHVHCTGNNPGVEHTMFPQKRQGVQPNGGFIHRLTLTGRTVTLPRQRSFGRTARRQTRIGFIRFRGRINPQPFPLPWVEWQR